MPQTVETIGTVLDADLRTLDFEPDQSAIIIGSGFNSTAVRVDNTVLKVGKSLRAPGRAVDLKSTYQYEQETQARFIAPNMQLADYAIVASMATPEQSRVVTVQDFVPGNTIAQHLAQDEPNVTELADLLRDCLGMFDSIGQIPDLAKIERWFSIFRDTNIVMRDDTPILVDVNYGKMQRSRLFGPTWSNAIAQATRRGLAKIEDGSFKDKSRLESLKGKMPQVPIGAI